MLARSMKKLARMLIGLSLPEVFVALWICFKAVESELVRVRDGEGGERRAGTFL